MNPHALVRGAPKASLPLLTGMGRLGVWLPLGAFVRRRLSFDVGSRRRLVAGLAAGRGDSGRPKEGANICPLGKNDYVRTIGKLFNS